MTYQQPEDEPRRRSNSAPGIPYDPTQTYAPYQGAEPSVPGWRPPQPKKHRTRNILLGIAGGFVALVVIGGIASAGKTPSSSTASSATTTVQDTQAAAPATTDDQATEAAAPVLTVATVPAQVTYKCTGSAPDGIDITYGPEGSSYQASHLPWSKTMSLDPAAGYFAINAQLSGSGHVSCTITVQQDDGTQTTATGNAEGGYNIADPEVCTDFTGGYDTCS